MTLRARLTLWYTGLLAGVLVLFGSAVYFILSYSLTRQIEDTLLNTAEDIRNSAVRDVEGNVGIPRLALDLTADVNVQLWNGDGVLLDQDPQMMDQPFDPASLNVSSATFSSVTIGSTHFRVLTYPLVVRPENRFIGYIQLSASLETVDQARDNLLLVLLLGGIFAVVIAGVVGWSTAGAALRPLDQVTDTALRITRAGDLARRIPLSGPPSGEVGRLVLAFNETLERLENLFESQRRFMADVSHELRTPLTTIRGNVDLVRRMGAADPISLDAITSEVDRMTRMVRDLLLLAQAETGKLPLAQGTVELDTLMLEVFHQAKVLAQGRVDVRIGQEDQVRVRGDRDRLKQVLLNLVANALEHTPDGGLITLGLKCVGEWARLTVTDTGPGIPKGDLPHIFERFYRVDRARKRSGQGGAGLGLSIAYWITRVHNGSIEVASEQGRGTTFSVWLPRLSSDQSKPSMDQKPSPDCKPATEAG